MSQFGVGGINYILRNSTGKKPWKLELGFLWTLSHRSVDKESTGNAGDPSSIPGSGRPPGEGIDHPLQYSWASLVAQLVKNPPAVRETWVQPLGWEDPLERQRLPTPVFWAGEFHVYSMGSQRVGYDSATFTFTLSHLTFPFAGTVLYLFIKICLSCDYDYVLTPSNFPGESGNLEVVLGTLMLRTGRNRPKDRRGPGT